MITKVWGENNGKEIIVLSKVILILLHSFIISPNFNDYYDYNDYNDDNDKTDDNVENG